MINNIEFESFGDSSIIIKSKNNKTLTLIYTILDSIKIKEIEDIVKTKSSIGLIFNPYQITYSSFKKKLINIIRKSKISNKKKNIKIWKIPVCYSKDYGIDLEFLSKKLKISIERIKNYHKKSTYKVNMIGFLPGFVYLDGNNELLNIPRKKTPRSSISYGSIGIARNQTGIYNLKSPGGWNIIGKTPIKLFNKRENPPIKIKEGDLVEFYEIDKKKFKEIHKEE